MSLAASPEVKICPCLCDFKTSKDREHRPKDPRQRSPDASLSLLHSQGVVGPGAYSTARSIGPSEAGKLGPCFLGVWTLKPFTFEAS